MATMLPCGNMRRLVATIAAFAMLVLLPVRALAFDTFWHSACSAGVAGHLKFSADATNALQFGTFGPDFFGPAYDKIFEPIDGDWVKKLGGQIRKAGDFMHFDNLAGYLSANWKYDYLFTRLAFNTAKTIALFYNDTSLNEGTRKILVLETLGSSLHMVQDFYAHSDWVHFDFVKMGFPQQKSEWGLDYAPSWFQFRAMYGSPPTDGPETWPMQPHTGIYPPKANAPLGNFKVPMSHTNMNHDNSQLFYEGATQIPYHKYGAHPATDAKSATDHQLYAVSSAAMASVEWITILEQQDSTVAQAIDFVKDWDIKKFNPAILTNLTSGLELALSASCVKKKWDGDNPPQARKNECTGGTLGRGVVGIGTILSQVVNADEWWAPYFTKNILEKLTDGIGDQATGKYSFDKAWLAARRVPPANTSPVQLADGLTFDAPSGATASGDASSVTVTGSNLGNVQVTGTSSSQSGQQSGQQSGPPPQQPGQPPYTPDPPTMDPPDSMYGNGTSLVAKRVINGKTYSCTAKGLTTAQYTNARLACRSLRAQ
jgi:hypothetical protein